MDSVRSNRIYIYVMMDTNMFGVGAVEMLRVSSIQDKIFRPTSKSSQFISILSLEFTACERKWTVKVN